MSSIGLNKIMCCWVNPTGILPLWYWYWRERKRENTNKYWKKDGTAACEFIRPTFCDPLDCSPLTPLSIGFSRRGSWSGLLFPPPQESFWLRVRTWVPWLCCTFRQILYHSTTWEAVWKKKICTKVSYYWRRIILINNRCAEVCLKCFYFALFSKHVPRETSNTGSWYLRNCFLIIFLQDSEKGLHFSLLLSILVYYFIYYSWKIIPSQVNRYYELRKFI